MVLSSGWGVAFDQLAHAVLELSLHVERNRASGLRH